MSYFFSRSITVSGSCKRGAGTPREPSEAQVKEKNVSALCNINEATTLDSTRDTVLPQCRPSLQPLHPLHPSLSSRDQWQFKFSSNLPQCSSPMRPPGFLCTEKQLQFEQIKCLTARRKVQVTPRRYQKEELKIWKRNLKIHLTQAKGREMRMRKKERFALLASGL